MKILIDGDGCPVIDIAISVAKKFNIEVVIMCDTSHIFNKEGAKTMVFSKGADSVDFALINYLEKEDVVVYEAGGKTHVGRILGCETDVITMDDTGTLLVNGTAQTGEIAFPTYAKEGITYPYTVPEGSVFILGDYRTHAKDSREFGPISIENVKAKVITILRRREL